MKLEVVRGTINCAGKHCPTIYRSDRGSFVVQGEFLAPESVEGIEVAPHEAIVEVPEELIQGLVNQLKG